MEGGGRSVCCNAAQSVCQSRARRKTGASEHAQGSGTDEPGCFSSSVSVYVARVISSRPSEEKSDHTLPQFASLSPASAVCTNVMMEWTQNGGDVSSSLRFHVRGFQNAQNNQIVKGIYDETFILWSH